MSAKINTGGSAFPEITTDVANDGNGNIYGQVYSYGGMTLRDYFAGQALNGICNSCNCLPSDKDMPEIARRAYISADAMLAERDKKK